MDSHSLIVSLEDAGQRLDKFAAAQVPHLTRSRVQQLIADGRLLRDGQAVTDASRKVKPGEYYILTEPQATPLDLQPLALALDIRYEDDHLLVINKPAGLTVHPAAGNRDHTLVNALLHHCGDSLSGIGGVMRPGIVHRIDKDTSGLLVVAKNDAAHQQLSAQLKSRALKRSYIAFAWGAPPTGKGTVDAPVARHPTKRKEMAIVTGGRHAVTHYAAAAYYPSPHRGEDGRGAPRSVTSRFPHTASPSPALSPVGGGILATQLRCDLDTGRTHQIRVHMKHLGCPLIGDATYGLSPKQRVNLLRKAGIIADTETEKVLLSLSRQALHAATLRFNHPVTGVDIQCDAPLPEDLRLLENALASLTKPS